MTVLRAIKDRLTSQAAKAFLESKIGKYGAITEFQIDSGAGRVRMVVLPKGETSPIEMNILRYEIVVEPKHKCFIVREVQCSREWISLAAADHLVGRKIPLPMGVGELLG